MKLRKCPRCIGDAVVRREPRYWDIPLFHVACDVCGIQTMGCSDEDDAIEDWNSPRHDDWRSDGWPDGDVLVLWDGRVFTGRLCDGYVDLDKEGIMPRLEKCKWKPLPGGDSE